MVRTGIPDSGRGAANLLAARERNADREKRGELPYTLRAGGK